MVPGVVGLQQSIDTGPERSPRLLLVRGELLQGVGVTDACQIAFGLPAQQGPYQPQAILVRARLKDFGPSRQIGLEPNQGLCSETRLGLIVGRRIILAFSLGGKDRGVGCMIKALGVAVGPKLRISRKRLGPEPGRGGEMASVIDDGNRDAISIDSNPVLRNPSELIAARFHPTATRSLASEE